MGGGSTGIAPDDLLLPARGLIVATGQTVGGKRYHRDQVMCTRCGRGLVAVAGRRIKIAGLHQHLRPDTVKAVQQRVQRAEQQRLVKSGAGGRSIADQHGGQSRGIEPLGIIRVERGGPGQPIQRGLGLLGQPVRSSHGEIGERVQRIKRQPAFGMVPRGPRCGPGIRAKLQKRLQKTGE